MHLKTAASNKPVIPCDTTSQEKEEETAVDAVTFEKSATAEEKHVEKQV